MKLYVFLMKHILFFIKKLGTNFSTLLIGILQKSEIFSWADGISLWLLFYLWLKDNHYVIHIINLDIQDQLE